MKKLLLTLALTGLIIGSNIAYAEGFGGAFGTLMTARTIGMGNASLTGGLGIADATTVFGTIRYGFADYLDGRFKLGLRDQFNSTDFTLGADLTYQILAVGQQSTDPFDLGLGGLFEYESLEGGSIWQLGGYALGSYPFALQNNMTLSPYGRLNLRLENYSSDFGGDESELEFGLNAGAMLQVTPEINTYLEFQIDGNDGIFLGAEFLVI